MGYNPIKFSITRRVNDAISRCMKIMPGDVALREDWPTLDDEGMIVDSSAGRN